MSGKDKDVMVCIVNYFLGRGESGRREEVKERGQLGFSEGFCVGIRSGECRHAAGIGVVIFWMRVLIEAIEGRYVGYYLLELFNGDAFLDVDLLSGMIFGTLNWKHVTSAHKFLGDSRLYDDIL